MCLSYPHLHPPWAKGIVCKAQASNKETVSLPNASAWGCQNIKPVEKKQLSIMGQSHIVRPSLLWSWLWNVEKEVLQKEQKKKAGKIPPLQSHLRERSGSLPGEIKSGCWECFPREHARLCCKFPLKPFLKWLNNPKSFAMYFSFHILFALPACPSQLKTFFLWNSS